MQQQTPAPLVRVSLGIVSSKKPSMPTQGDLGLTMPLYTYLLWTLFCTLLQVLWERVERKKWIYIHLWTISNYGPQLAPNKKRGTGKQMDQWGKQGRKEGNLCVLDSGLVKMPLSWSNDSTGVRAYGCSVVSVVSLCDPMNCAHQAPLSMGFYRQEYWSGLPCPPPGDLPDPGIKPSSPASPAL